VTNDNDIVLAARALLKTLVVVSTGSVTLSATPTGFKRTVGSFVDDGFHIGMEVSSAGFTTNSVSVIKDVSDTEIVIADARTAQGAGAGRTLTVGLPAARRWDGNMDFTPPDAAPFIEEEYVPQPPKLRGMTEEGVVEVMGLYIIRWYGLLNTAAEPLRLASSALKGLFRTGFVSLALPNNEWLRVREDMLPFTSQIIPAPDTKRPVFTFTAPLRVFTFNS